MSQHLFNYDPHKEKFCFIQFSAKIYWNRSLAASASELFHIFIESIKFYTFLCHVWKSTYALKSWFIK